jgi:glycerol-3-phosphate dehydrogenase
MTTTGQVDPAGTPRGKVLFAWPGDGCESGPQFRHSAQLGSGPYDVAIIGAGVVGCALACELSKYQLRVLLLDRNFDVGEGTSKGNSAIIHTGFDATPGTLESHLVGQASRLWPRLAERLKIPFRPIGGLVLALDPEQAAMLPKLRDKALANGVDDVAIVSAAEVRELQPHASPTACGGLVVPRESIVDPFTVSIALAELAVTNGVDLLLGVDIVDILEPSQAIKQLVDAQGNRFPARVVVNAAGLGSRGISDRYQGEPFDINPRRGQFLVYDRCTLPLVTSILLPVPTAHTKGKLVTPTIFGNLLAGPTAEDLPLGDPAATSTTLDGLAEVREAATRMCPSLADHQPIANYAGARCHCAQGSYQVRLGDGGHAGMVTITGVRSTGLTSSPALATYLVEQISETGWLTLTPDPQAVEERPASRWPGWWRRPWDDPQRVVKYPDYGRIVCFCEQISRQEIIDALSSPPAPKTLDAVKRRTRALTGRCQGFNCLVRTAQIVACHGDTPLEGVTKSGPGSSRLPCAKSPAGRRGSDALTHVALTHVRVAIVGGGPAGLGAAIGLARRGIGPILLIDRWDTLGGVPAKYPAAAGNVPTYVAYTRGKVVCGQQLVDGMLRQLAQTAVESSLETSVIGLDPHRRRLTAVNPRHGKHVIQAEAIVLATGAREQTAPERGWIAGDRQMSSLQTMQLLELLNRGGRLPWHHPVIAGSDLIAYAAAAKLKVAGAEHVTVIDTTDIPQTSWLARRYFGRWVHPRWKQQASVHISSTGTARPQLRFEDGSVASCDALVVSGQLVPNSELLVEAGIATRPPSQIPLTGAHGRLSAPGCFAVGNLLGGFHGGQWCYYHGRRVARSVAAYLRTATKS